MNEQKDNRRCEDYKGICCEEENNMDAVLERYCTVTESLEESLKQMQMIRQGKLQAKSWKEFKKELKEEREKENNN